jgi:hypothetical protein
MTPRQRVQTALVHNEPNRVPLALGGGYILAPFSHLQADLPPENVGTLFETAHEFGKYPIKI